MTGILWRETHKQTDEHNRLKQMNTTHMDEVLHIEEHADGSLFFTSRCWMYAELRDMIKRPHKTSHHVLCLHNYSPSFNIFKHQQKIM